MSRDPAPAAFTVDDAIALARTAHAGQTDKAGRPYIEPPSG